MRNLIRYNNEKATLCASNKCVTVYGQTAQTINTIAVLAAITITMAYVSKVLR